MTENPHITELVAICHWIGTQGWCPATGGNMSVRIDPVRCVISESGQDKGQISPDHFIPIDIQTSETSSPRRPSAETRLHTLIYRLFPAAQTVLHTHSVNSTVLSRVTRGNALGLTGYEMQKTLQGQTTHEATVTIPIFENSQDIAALAVEVAQYHQQQGLHYGLLVRGHGLYCWGNSVQEARRHLEGLEFLFACELQRRLLEDR